MEKEKAIRLTVLNQKEVLRLLGNRNTNFDAAPNSKMKKLMVDCQRELIQTARPRYTYKLYDVDDARLPLIGADINMLLSKCERVIFFAATLSVETDMLIRRAQITDMSKAVILDAMASVAIEQVCDKLTIILEDNYPEYRFTRRFSPGYGDFPIDVQEDFITLVEASKKIGLSVTESGALTPNKSVTAIIGMAHRPSRFTESREESEQKTEAEMPAEAKKESRSKKQTKGKEKKQGIDLFKKLRKEKKVPVYEGIDIDYIKSGKSAEEEERDIFSEPQPLPVGSFNVKRTGPAAITWPERPLPKQIEKDFIIDNDFEVLPEVTYKPGLAQTAKAMRTEAEKNAEKKGSHHDCETCNMKDTCDFKRRNKHCENK